MAVRDSLFSLEVIVDQLVLPSVTCRFPAVAFRLLDFPTLLVQHVEPELADRIKKKISIEMQANLPRQLKELQDKNGAFLVKRGKSCLFKISSETLQIHLSNTPLYVLVIDQFPETPKLVASCLIPLNECMEKIKNDIEKLGITVPHVHGEKGQYKLYNLMGIEVGHVNIACRLLSLGEGLMQHIPDHAIAKFGVDAQGNSILAKEDSPRKTKPGTPRKSSDGSPRKVDDSPRKAKTPKHVVIKTPPRKTDDDLIVEDLEAPEKGQPIIISSAKDAIEAAKTGRELENSGTQTERSRKSKHVQFPSSDLSDELDNVYLTNTYCPPPLFYNSTAEEKLPPSKLEIYEYHSRPAKPLEVKDFDTESVRSDDALFDLIEQGLDQTLIKPSDTKFIHYQHSLLPPPPKQPDLQQMLMSPNFQVGQFPFLRALTAELAFIQNTQAQVASQSQGAGRGQGSPTRTTEISQQKHRSPRTPQTPRDVRLEVMPPAEKENREHFLTRLAAPKRKLPEKQGAVPSNKGWLRKEPVFGQRKTKPKFSYGMTNTQRLRLAQVNPELLHSLELEQEEVKLRKQQEQFENMSNIQKAMAKTFVLNPAPRGMDDVTVDSRTMLVQKPSHMKPVPTPRKVSIDDTASLKEVSPTELIYEARLAQAQVPIDHPDTPSGKVMKLEDLHEAAYDYEPSGSSSKHSGGSSQKSIEVRVPAVSMNDSAGYSTDGDSRPPSVVSKVDDKPVKEKPVHPEERPPKYGQVRSSYPGFPTAFQLNDTQTTAKTESTLHYTDDFEDSKQWMSTDEPELQALRYSVSESGDEGSESCTLTGEASDPTDDGVRTSTTIRIPIVNPKASLNSPKAAIKKSASFRAADSTARTLEGDSSTDKGSLSPTPVPRKSVTPPGDGSQQRLKLQRSVSFEFDEEEPVKEKVPPPYPRKGSKSADPASSLEMSQEKPTPRRRANVGRSPSAESVESPTRQRKGLVKPMLPSIHTESVSSYIPSDLDLNMTYDGSDDDYSDDFDNSEGAYQPVYKPASEATVAKGAGRLGYTWN
ncbi:microtubule-associated protein 10-like [Lineus longissimus]|uniref:microtubule-associated protein 10-like n=1 Tax=Lineus longissimus TaxID=88925 RepID=UPI00315D30E3